jgi:tRNA(fMet)-specific endonuclease VapC
VLGELYYGALYSTRVQKNVTDIKRIINNYNILLIDEAVSLAYGNIKASLRKKGKPIPENDIWIAAIAQHYQLTLATRDKHFKEIDNIKIKNW